MGFDYLFLGCLVPLFIFSAIQMFIHGWKILKKKEMMYSWIVKVRFRIIKSLHGDERFLEYKNKLDTSRNWTYWGYANIVYGFLYMGLVYLVFLRLAEAIP